MTTLKERIIWARAQKSERDGMEFTQEDLAKKAGVTQGAIAHLESGRTASSREIVEIAYVLGVNARWLTYGKGAPFPEYQVMAEGRMSDAGAEISTKLPSVPSPSERREISLESGIRLLTLFNGTDDDGRSKIMKAANRVPQMNNVTAIRKKS